MSQHLGFSWHSFLVTRAQSYSWSFSSNGTISNDTQLWEALKTKSPPWGYLRSLGNKTRCTGSRKDMRMQGSRWLPGAHMVPAHASRSRTAAHGALTAERGGIAESKSSMEREHSFAEPTRLFFCLAWPFQAFLPCPQTSCLPPKATTIWLVPTKVDKN